MAKSKPVILGDYDLHKEDTEAFDFSAYFDKAQDPSYIPGYSEQVQANEIGAVPENVWYEQHKDTGITKESQYKLIGKHPAPLPVEYMWLRTQDVSGLPSASVARGLMEYADRKYRVARWPNDLEPYGFGQPPAGHLEADGTIRRDDVTLYVVDGRAATAFRKAQQEYTQKLENPTGRDGVEVIENKRETVTVTT